MQLEDLRLAASRAWRDHLMRCAAVALILVIAPIERYRQMGFLSLLVGFNGWWGVFSLMMVAYSAERTRYEWHRLQVIRKLQSLPSPSELQISKMKEKLHHSVLNAALLCCTFALIAYMDRKLGFLFLSNELFLWILPIIALGPVWKAWRDLQRVVVQPARLFSKTTPTR